MNSTSQPGSSVKVKYRLPNQLHFNELEGSPISLTLLESWDDDDGFLFVPFGDVHKGLFIPKCSSQIKQFMIDNQGIWSSEYEINSHDGTHFQSIVEEALECIKNGEFEKVVLARSKSIIIEQGYNLHSFFLRLCYAYPSAFVYYLELSDGTIWMGATPEMLLSVEGMKIYSEALAGTRNKKNQFSGKDRNEQNLVEEYIEAVLGNHVSSILKTKSERNTGPLIHIATEFKAELKNKDWENLVLELHPTPAVCGTPKQIAKEFILKHEGFDREFYSGFLGPVTKEKSQLYVNLRCCKVQGNLLTLYAGAGIVKHSVPQKEFEETEAKMQVLLKYL